MRKAGDHGKDALLLSKAQVRLEPDKIIERARAVLAAQLHNRPRAMACARITQADRLERAVADRIRPAPRHDFNWHTALVHTFFSLVKVVQRRRLGRAQRLIKRLVLLFIKRAVDIIAVSAIIARGEKHPVQIERFIRHNRRGRVVKTERPAAQLGNTRRKRVRCERPGCNHRQTVKRDIRHFAGHNLNQSVGADTLCHERRKRVAIHRERPAGRYARRFGAGDCQRAEHAHFLLEHTGGRAKPARLE